MMKLRIDPDLPDHFKSLRVVSIRCMISYKFSWSWIWSIIKIDHSSIQKKLLFWSLQFPHRGNQPSEHIIFWKAMERRPGWLWKQGLKSSCGGCTPTSRAATAKKCTKKQQNKATKVLPPHKTSSFFNPLIVHAASKSMQLWILSLIFPPFSPKNVKLSSKQPEKMSTHPWIWVDKSRFWPDILRILIDLQNTSYPTQPHSIIANYLFRTVYPRWTLFYLLTYHACICFFIYFYFFHLFIFYIISYL